jgi:hypothetical protein
MNRSNQFASRMALLAIACTLLSACSTPARISDPTFQDYLSIEDAMHAYHYGLDTKDDKLRASAFTKDGRVATVVEGKEIRVEYPNQPEKDIGGPSGYQAKGELWHLAYPGHIKFESATRATNYGYWTSLFSEAKGPRDSQVGSPGHYEDIFEKQADGRWLFVERKVVVGTKK